MIYTQQPFCPSLRDVIHDHPKIINFDSNYANNTIIFNQLKAKVFVMNEIIQLSLPVMIVISLIGLGSSGRVSGEALLGGGWG